MNKVIFVVLLGLGFSVTTYAQQTSAPAAAKPAGPEPITAIFLPVRVLGINGTTHPSE